MNIVELPRAIVNQLLEQALTSPDTEICGLIASHNGQPKSCYPVTNVAQHPHNQFQLDEKQQIIVMREMRNKGETLFAIYHSHPGSPATPSITDIEKISYPEALMLIISLHTTGCLQMKAYRHHNHKLQTIHVNIADTP